MSGPLVTSVTLDFVAAVIGTHHYAEVCRSAIFISYMQENNLVGRGISAIKSAGMLCACPCKCQLQYADDLHEDTL